MKRWPEIPYLRWARSQASPPFPEIPLVQSGMAPPDPSILGSVALPDLLHFPVEDHPPLTFRLAEEWKVAPEKVLIQPGTHMSLFLLLAARLGEHPGTVVVEDPAYEPLWAIPEALGAEVVRWPRPRARNFGLDAGAIERLAQTRPSVVMLTHPHNPTGAILTAADLEAVAELQRRTGCAVIADEVYAEFVPPADFIPVRTVGEDVAAVRSFTKVFGLGTLKCTGIAAPTDWVERVAELSDHVSLTVPGPSQALAHRAWDHRHALWQRARDAATTGRAVVQEWAKRQGDRIEVHVPSAGIICFPRLDDATHRAMVASARRNGVDGPFGFGLDRMRDGSHLWIEDLRRRSGVQLVPGAFFGDPHAFRLGYGGNPDVLRQGLARLDEYIHEARAQAAE